MKTLISSEGNRLKSAFDLLFGRAAWFCLLDEANGKTTFFKNEFKDESQGAGGRVAGWQGGRVAEKAIDMGVTKVISGDFGPKAKDLLEKFKVQMVILPNGNKTVEEIISLLK